jgi:hypothetical protein
VLSIVSSQIGVRKNLHPENIIEFTRRQELIFLHDGYVSRFVQVVDGAGGAKRRTDLPRRSHAEVGRGEVADAGVVG